MKHPAVFFLTLLALAASELRAQMPSMDMRRGERQYQRAQYQKSENTYKAVDSPEARYNQANAVLQQGRYGEAAALYQEAANKSDDPKLRADAYYNKGNALMMQGNFEEALNAYKRSLALLPNQPDARRNLQIAWKKIREQQDPPPPQQEPPPPPPKSPPPRTYYLDRGAGSQKRASPTGPLNTQEARNILEKKVQPQEERSARQYRTLAPAVQKSKTKDW